MLDGFDVVHDVLQRGGCLLGGQAHFLDVVLINLSTCLYQNTLVGVEIGFGEVQNLLALLGDRDLAECDVESLRLTSDDLRKGAIYDDHPIQSCTVSHIGGHAVLETILDRIRRVAIPPSRRGQYWLAPTVLPEPQSRV